MDIWLCKHLYIVFHRTYFCTNLNTDFCFLFTVQEKIKTVGYQLTSSRLQNEQTIKEKSYEKEHWKSLQSTGL